MRGVAGPTAHRLHERERELAEIEARLDAAGDGRGSVCVVDAPAGLGKSSLLAAARDRAAARGFRVLTGRGDTLAAEHPWSVATQLFGEVPQAPSGDATHDPFPLIHGLTRASANLADQAPLLLAVDDAHWGDLLTLRFLGYLGARLDGLRIVVLVAQRTAEPVPPAITRQLQQIAALPGARVMNLRPLSADSVAQIVSAAVPDAAEVCRAAIYEATGGNPFLTEELLRSARSEGRALEAPETAAVLRTSRPPTIRAAIGVRLAALGPDAVAVAEAVALLGPSANGPAIAALARLTGERCAHTVDRLVAADLLAHPAPGATGEPVRFVHPVVHEVVYGSLGPARAARGHLHCAEYLFSRRAAASEIADHLLRAEPCDEAWVIEQLAAAADAAKAQRAPDRGVTLLRRALDLCRDSDRRDELVVRLAAAELGTGSRDGGRCVGEAVAALPRVIDRMAPDELGNLALTLYAHGRFAEARTAFEAALTTLIPPDPVTHATLVAGREMAGLLAAEPSRNSVPHTGRTLPGAEDDVLAQRVLAALAAGRVALGVDVGVGDTAGSGGTVRDRVLGLVRRADPATLPPSLAPTVLEPVALALWLCDEFATAAELIGPALDAATRDGALVVYASLLPLRALLALGSGDLRAAVVEADTAIRLSAEFASPYAVARAPAEHALVSAGLEIGDRTAARVVQPRSDAASRATSPIDGWHLHALGRLALADGRHTEALELLLRAGDLFSSAGGPGAYCEWRTWAAHAAHALGAAQQAAELAADELRWAERLGSPRAISRALRCRARTVDRSDSLDLLHRAVATIDDSPARLERAHAHVELGAALRRAGRRSEARDHLWIGAEAAHECGAVRLTARASDELQRSGARRTVAAPHGLAALTPSEARVAELAAHGLSNREIAEVMFLSRKTVEVHLTRAYRKLGIGGRAELGGALAAG